MLTRTYSTTLVNWWPTKQKRESASATKELAEIITNLIAARRREGRRENDPIQYQMDMGDEDSDIIQYTFKILFAGSVNTAAMAAWTWVYVRICFWYLLLGVPPLTGLLSLHSSPCTRSSTTSS